MCVCVCVCLEQIKSSPCVSDARPPSPDWPPGWAPPEGSSGPAERRSRPPRGRGSLTPARLCSPGRDSSGQRHVSSHQPVTLLPQL